MNRKSAYEMRILLIASLVIWTSLVQAQLTLNVGNPDFSDWSGIVQVENNTATVKDGERIAFTYSDQDRIYFPNISRNYYGDAANWVPYSGLAFEVQAAKVERPALSMAPKSTPQER